MKASVLLVIAVIVLIVVLVSCKYYINPVDVFSGKERNVARQQLPNGDTIEIIQYWNNGDFYNLDLRHTTQSGTRLECVIDPDCNRITGCKMDLNVPLCELTVTIGSINSVRYNWVTKELVRKNGVLIPAVPVRQERGKRS